MAKKEGKKESKADSEGESGTVSSIKAAVREVVSANILGHAREYLQNLTHQAQEIAYQTEKKILDNLFAGIILAAGSLLLILAVVFFINDF